MATEPKQTVTEPTPAPSAPPPAPEPTPAPTAAPAAQPATAPAVDRVMDPNEPFRNADGTLTTIGEVVAAADKYRQLSPEDVVSAALVAKARTGDQAALLELAGMTAEQPPAAAVDPADEVKQLRQTVDTLSQTVAALRPTVRSIEELKGANELKAFIRENGKTLVALNRIPDDAQSVVNDAMRAVAQREVERGRDMTQLTQADRQKLYADSLMLAEQRTRTLAETFSPGIDWGSTPADPTPVAAVEVVDDQAVRANGEPGARAAAYTVDPQTGALVARDGVAHRQNQIGQLIPADRMPSPGVTGGGAPTNEPPQRTGPMTLESLGQDIAARAKEIQHG